ncbi:hypothetical protein ACHWQZ_G006630 [Mnemiopsis leidyi]
MILHAKEMAYPRFRDKLHLQELRRYTLSLGMQRDSLVKFLKPAINKDGDTYFSISSLNELLDNKTANQVLHRTFNVYSAEYNTQVIRKSLHLVINRRLSFVELQEVRSLFEAYESEDLEGMPANEHTIYRILKHCGRSIAPLKLQHQLKKMKDDVDTAGRLQFYELLDIIPYTTYIKDIEVPLELFDGTAKDSQKLYKIDNFHNFLYTHDEKVKKELDKDYRHIISRAIYSEQGPKVKGREKLIEHTRQDQLEEESRLSYQALKEAVRHSSSIVALSRGGKVLRDSISRATTKTHVTTPTKNVFICDEPPRTIDKPKHILEPLILQKDIDKQDALMEDLEWEMINNAEKYNVSVKKKLDELKTKKKYRDNRHIFSQPPSTAPGKNVDIYAIRPSRPSTVTDAYDLYSTFEDDNSFRTKLTSSGTIDMVDDTDTAVSDEQPVFRDITLDQEYQTRKQILLEKVKLIKQGKRLVDL